MSESTLYPVLLAAWLVLAAGVSPLLFLFTAPYGRHVRQGWGPALPDHLGWVIMEAPAALAFALLFALGPYRDSPVSWAFLGLWEAHYLHRAFVYPWTRRSRSRPMPLAIVGMGFFFNVVNAYLNGRYLFALSGGYPLTWLRDLRFLAGTALFLAGLAVNRQSDHILRSLRRPGENGYRIPHGGLYRWVSCPNYLGEIAEWTGWALATWSLPGLAFAVWTTANLAPRAWAHHRWYREHFPDYPPERKALLPGLW